jgi:hypothetical protein
MVVETVFYMHLREQNKDYCDVMFVVINDKERYPHFCICLGDGNDGMERRYENKTGKWLKAQIRAICKKADKWKQMELEDLKD